jgi:hypothetical protein
MERTHWEALRKRDDELVAMAEELRGEQNRLTRAEGELGGAHEDILEERRRETATRYY